ncbi:enoyl-CoA hydratase-related protein [Corynebacterium heidelbergense]|uniref:Probable enoyl-CoA hydratase echA8 n=1 Tax=Corynebacterium heidelbergense TaxID=2055947 RepID=A0A364V9Q4_9CORY|nr:enoyl-CoA hydratase-related protein [Corynebacterium heidelbergense]RAV33369.1 enoyl-CoA hydratase [Corynebacterium heidelbergense]WCZ35973.1 putative enoyl-CoA hydratase echA8 [Corynebacterium heidelbergense]
MTTNPEEDNKPTYEAILTSVDGGVATIAINRPKALNALNSTVMEEVITAAEGYDRDPAIGAIVLTGGEKAFAAGADIKQMKDETYPEIAAKRMFLEWERLAELRTPLITAVSGYALGGGCEVAMLGDILLASETAVFGQPEINLGIIPGMGGTQRLTRAVGKFKAMDLILTGRNMDAEEAERSGLVSRVLPAENFDEEVAKIARTVAGKSQVATTAASAMVDAAYETTLRQGVRTERETFWSLFATQDQKEGMDAFANKRKPAWQNR